MLSNSLRLQFKGVDADPCEKASNCLLGPLRYGLGYRSWDGKINSVTVKVACVCMAIFAVTLWLIPTLIGLALWKISKTHPKHCLAMQKVQAQQQKKLPVIIQVALPHAPESHATSSNEPPASLANFSTILEKAEQVKVLLKKSLETPEKSILDALGHDLEAVYAETVEKLSVSNGSYVDDKPLMHILSRTLFLEAERMEGNVEETLALCQGALSLRILKSSFQRLNEACGGVFTANSSLELLKKHSGSVFNQRLDDLLTRSKDVVQDVISKWPEQIFDIAEITNSIGKAYLNLAKTKNDCERVEKFLGIARELFSHLDTPDSRWEMAKTFYNTGMRIYYLKNPNDVEGALATYKELDLYLQAEGLSLRAQLLRADILNENVVQRSKHFRQLSATDLLKMHQRCFVDISKAVEIADQTPGFDDSRKIRFMNNKVKVVLQCLYAGLDVATMAEVGVWVEGILNFLKQEKYNHHNHVVYACNAALYEIMNKNQQKAQMHLNLAEWINAKFPSHSVDNARYIKNVFGVYNSKFNIP